MPNTCFKHLVLLATSFVLMDTALATTPLPFYSFTVSGTNGGEVSADCTSAFTGIGVTAVCGIETLDNGFLQREVVVSGYTGANASLNGRYIQFIVTEPGVSGDAGADPFSLERGNLLFSNQDFVKMNNRGEGLSSKLTLIESTTSLINPDIENRFVSSHTFNIGAWATAGGMPFMDTTQEITQVDYSGVDPLEVFSTSAEIISRESQLGSSSTSKDISLAQFVDMTTEQGSGAQRFQFKEVNRLYQGTTRTGDGSLLPGGTNGGDISWGSNDKLTATWVGQTLTTDSVEGDTVFGHTRYQNLTSAQETELTSQTDAEAQGWTLGPFGSVASITDPTPIVAATNPVMYTPPSLIQPTIAPGTASTDPTVFTLPIQYNDWEVTDGIFYNVGCPGGGAICYPPIVNEGGLYQRLVVIAGVEYVQTIITDSNATGDGAVTTPFAANSLGFKNETIVRRDQLTGGGVAGILHIAEQDNAYQNNFNANSPLPSTAGEFVYDSKIKTGWAHGGPLDATLTVDQRITIPEFGIIGGSGIENIFHLENGETQADKKMAITTAVGWSNWSFPIMFSTSKVQGAFQNTSHTAGAPDLLPGNVGDISWSEGDAIQATWMGARYVVFDPFSDVAIRSTSYTNLSTGERTENTIRPTNNVMLVNLNPESWVDPFATYDPSAPDPTYPGLTNTYTPTSYVPDP